MFICTRTIYFKNNLCLQKGIPLCQKICDLSKSYGINVKFHHSYFGDNDRGLFLWQTESLDKMNTMFEKFLHDAEYQKINEKIITLTSEGSAHDDIWRLVNDH